METQLASAIKKILVATDLTENGRRAFHYAASLATQRTAIVLLYVIEESPGTMQQQVRQAFTDEEWARLELSHKRSARSILMDKRTDYEVVQDALSHLCTSAQEAEPGQFFDVVEILLEKGHVAKTILSTAAEKGCDMIAMGAHRGVFRKKRVGSVAKEVLRSSPVPVLLVPPADPG